ncbi:MAG: DUF86 domain-containing protein [Cyanobacteria bacterium CRU_2_1]|nr:DUF86 domain-containing protein [Cyanobacteria bacterium CRU_2_1]
MNFEQFVADDRTFDPVIRNLQMIGEAVKNVPVDIRDHNPGLKHHTFSSLLL